MGHSCAAPAARPGPGGGAAPKWLELRLPSPSGPIRRPGSCIGAVPDGSWRVQASGHQLASDQCRRVGQLVDVAARDDRGGPEPARYRTANTWPILPWS